MPEALVTTLARQGIAEPFPIQAATLSDALAGRDLCGKAPTGSGKTLAFGLPLLAGLAAGDRWSDPRKPQALILLPTRELASQVSAVLAPLATAVGARIATVYGGVGYHPQRQALRKGVDLLVACPGRLEDLIAQGDVELTQVRWVVLDEADRMADMGFLPAVRRLLDQVGPRRQVLLFSATLDGDVDVLVKRYLSDPARHEVAGTEQSTGEVTHLWWRTTRDERTSVTAALVRAYAPAVVFCRTRHGADRVCRRLAAAGVTAAPVHGSRSQPQRDRAIAAFAGGSVDALVATDVAARGIHIDGVGVVVHFDPPGEAKDYTHRSGRTGRAGADGIVVTLVTPEVAGDVASLQRQLGHPGRTEEPDLASLPVAAPRRAAGPAAGAPAEPSTAERTRTVRRADHGYRDRGASASTRSGGGASSASKGGGGNRRRGGAPGHDGHPGRGGTGDPGAGRGNSNRGGQGSGSRRGPWPGSQSGGAPARPGRAAASAGAKGPQRSPSRRAGS
ncbi:MAG: DEAD/DEAH box helicase [Actinomycetota bacterium]|nr:DEAD/DEAH box helicase [Actinomycetota bacterium]